MTLVAIGIVSIVLVVGIYGCIVLAKLAIERWRQR